MPPTQIYLDYNATSPLLPEVSDALPELATVSGNPSSWHAPGVEARRRVEAARKRIAKFIGAAPGQVIFTSGATESNNLVLFSAVARSRLKKPHILISSIEHPAVLEPCERLVREYRAEVELLTVDNTGRVRVDDLERRIRKETVFISVMAANNEVGTLQPVSEIARIAGKRGIPVHTDAVQWFGRLPLSVKDLGVSYLSASGHKIGALKGIGVLFADRPTSLGRLFEGGPQENGHHPGTENTLGILSMGVAVDAIAPRIRDEGSRLRDLRQRLLDGISKNVPDVVCNTPLENSIPNTLNVSFRNAIGSALALSMSDEGIYVSTTSACETGQRDLSHVLEAMGVEPETNRSAIRFSLGHNTTEGDIDRVIEILPPLVEKSRNL